MILSPPHWLLHIPGGRSVNFVVVHIIIDEFVQLVIHVVITVHKKGRSNSNADTTATIYEDPSAIAAIHDLPTYNFTTHAAVPLSIHGHTLTALIDSCSSDSFMSENITKMLKLQIKPSARDISMALSTMNTQILEYCEIDLKLNGHGYKNVRLSLLKGLCSDAILAMIF